MAELRTERLALRQWHKADFEPFAALNADPEVMRYFPSSLTREQSDALAEREQSRIAGRGDPSRSADVSHANTGEAATRLKGPARSRKVVERLGMTHDPVDDFEHPLLPRGHPLRPFVLRRDDFRQEG